jgi:hypothetical protein
MVASVTAVLSRFKTERATQLQSEAIIGACEGAGYTAWRDLILTPVTTIHLFLLQIPHGHTACSHLPHLSGLETFGQPTVQRPGCGFPVARLLGLFHASTGLLLKLVVAPLLTHDLAQVQGVHPSLRCPKGLLQEQRGICYKEVSYLPQIPGDLPCAIPYCLNGATLKATLLSSVSAGICATP